MCIRDRCLLTQGATVGFDPQTGILGLLSPQWLALHIWVVVLGAVCSCIIYSKVIWMWPPVSVEFCLLAEPLVAILMVWIMGWQGPPGLLVIVGGAALLASLAYVTIDRDKDRVENIDLEIVGRKSSSASIQDPENMRHLSFRAHYKQMRESEPPKKLHSPSLSPI
eukprot:TRINITY_DN7077_c0_g1_i17.p1 TRINITY_DN7077_c0_g1~~TRINITY_DN7077_c0_g1_i17.p1  ORF type:complete len:189 (-),score=15.41 TRINITY_DN7077_c0_g1_i17:44-541(-)